MSSDKNPAVYWYTFALCFLIISFRGWSRLAYAELYAEDASVFLADALRNGLSSIVDPYAGSYHTIQRLISLGVVASAPVSSWAFVINIICYAIAAGVAAAIVRLGHSWIIPSTSARIGVAMMLCFVPGLNEMLGNLCNLNWMLLFWLALLGLRHPSLKITWLELMISALIVFSVGTVILIIPLFAWRLWHIFKVSDLRGNRARESILFVLLILPSIWLILLNRHDTIGYVNPNTSPNLSGLEFVTIILNQGPQLLLEHLYRLLVLTPWLGMNQQTQIWYMAQPAFLNWIFSIVVTVLMGWYLAKNWRNSMLPVLLFVAGIAIWPALNWIARPGPIDSFMRFAMSDQCRYAYPLSSAAILFWMAAFRPKRFLSGYQSYFAFAFILINLGLQADKFWLTLRLRPAPMEKTTLWSEFSPQLDSSIKTGCPASVFVPAYPAGWGLEYRSVKINDCSKVSSARAESLH